MEVMKKGAVAHWWRALAAFAGLVCVGLAASSALAAVSAPVGGASGDARFTFHAAGALPGRPGANAIGPSVPLTCSNDYVFSTSTGASIDPGTTLVPGSQADEGVIAITLPFTYYHYGTPFSTAKLSMNGNLQFTSTHSQWNNACPLPYASFNNAIMPHWDDLDSRVATCGAGCGIYTSTVGSPGSRIFNIEWRTRLFDSAGTVNFEARLYEAASGGNGESRFDLVYGAVQDNGLAATIGVQKGTGSQSTMFSCNTASLSSGLQIIAVQNPCGGPTFTPTRTPTGTFTPTPTFTPVATNTPACEVTNASSDAPKLIADQATTTSTLTVPGTIGILSDVDIVGLVLTHTYDGDLSIRLVSPLGTSVIVVGNICGSSDDMNFNLDDSASAAVDSVCPPTTGGTFRPGGAGAGTLSTFNGESGSGTWSLVIVDQVPGDSGNLLGWGLRLRSAAACPLVTSTPTSTPTRTNTFTQSPTSTITPTSTPTNTRTSTPTITPTRTPTTAPVLVVHVTWQGIAQPSSRNTTETVTATLRLSGGGPAYEYTGYTTDADGYFTLPVGSVPAGTYLIRVKGPRNLSSGIGPAVCADTVSLTGGPVTNYEAGTMRAGDASNVGLSNFNVVNATDFTILKATFGKSFGQPGYDARADFDNNDVVNSTDFTLLKGNFGQSGCGPGLGP